jgi:Fic family protein
LASYANAVRLLDYVFEQPILTVRFAQRQLKCSYVTAATAIDCLVDKGVLREMTGAKRNRIFRFEALLNLFQPQIPAEV